MTELRSSDKKSKNDSAGAFASALLLIFSALLFKVTLTNMLGAVGRGYFNSVFELFVPVLVISLACIPEVAARLVSQNVYNGRFRDARLVSRIAGRLVLISGLAGTLLTFIIAYPYAKLFAGTGVLPSLFIIAAAVVPCCISNSIRGYYEGLDIYSASKLCRAVEVLAQCGFATLFIKLFKDRGALQFASAAGGTGNAVVFGTTVGDLVSANGVIAVRAALGAVLGVAVGSIAGAAFAFVFRRVRGDGITKKELALSPKSAPSKTLFDGIFEKTRPLFLFAVLLFAAGIIDICVIQKRLSFAVDGETGFNLISQMYAEAFSSAASSSVLNMSDKEETAKYLFGIYGVSVDITALSALIALLVCVPFMRKSFSVDGEGEAYKSEVEFLLKKTVVLSMPFGFCISLMSKPLFSVLFGNGAFADTMQITAKILFFNGLFAFLISLAVSGVILLCASGKTSLAIKITAAAALIKTVLDFVLTGIPKLNVSGPVISAFAAFTVTAVAASAVLVSSLKIRSDFVSTFLKPAICSVLCAFSGYCSVSLLGIIIPDFNSGSFFSGKTLSLVISAAFSVLVYIISLIFVKEFSKSEVFSHTKQEKIAKTLEKYGFLG